MTAINIPPKHTHTHTHTHTQTTTTTTKLKTNGAWKDRPEKLTPPHNKKLMQYDFYFFHGIIVNVKPVICVLSW